MNRKALRAQKYGVRRVFAASAALAIMGSVSGCASIFSEEVRAADAPETAWLNDGLLAIARPVPPAATQLALSSFVGERTIESAAPAIDSTTMLGFMPLPPTQRAAWLSIDTTRQTVSLLVGSNVITSQSGEGIGHLKPGVYKVAHKQLTPSWYAPDSYFELRSLPVPPEGDRSRFRRGALGEKALFLDKDTPLHNGSIWSSEVGGVKLERNILDELYEALEVGATVEVK